MGMSFWIQGDREDGDRIPSDWELRLTYTTASRMLQVIGRPDGLRVDDGEYSVEFHPEFLAHACAEALDRIGWPGREQGRAPAGVPEYFSSLVPHCFVDASERERDSLRWGVLQLMRLAEAGAACGAWAIVGA